LEDLFSSVLSHFKKYRPTRNLELNYFGICQSLKLRILMEKILSICLKRNFTPNTLGCYGLNLFLIMFDLISGNDITTKESIKKPKTSNANYSHSK